jgi:outer membrane immunogenic protein
MRSLLFSAMALAILPSSAMAQSTDMSSKFEGFRIEGNVGWDRSHALGSHDSKLGYGATVGWDGSLGDKLLIGPQATYWTAHNGAEVCGAGGIDGTVCTKSFEEWGAGVRVGYKLTPNVVLFGTGGYVTAEQRKRLVTPAGIGDFYDHYHTDGYSYGGGAELSMANRFSGVLSGLYLNAQYVRSQYDDHTARERVMGGIGLHFR